MFRTVNICCAQVQRHFFPNLNTRWIRVVSFTRQPALAPAEIAPVVRSVGDLVGTIACLDTLGEIETFVSAGIGTRVSQLPSL